MRPSPAPFVLTLAQEIPHGQQQDQQRVGRPELFRLVRCEYPERQVADAHKDGQQVAQLQGSHQRGSCSSCPFSSSSGESSLPKEIRRPLYAPSPTRDSAAPTS